MMKFIKELCDKYAASFYVDAAPYGGYRLWVAGVYVGSFEDFDEIRAWCAEHLKERA